MIKSQFEKVLKSIPKDTWDRIITKEPEYIYFKPLKEHYHFGAFAIIMLVSGLNAYQLKGKAQDKYFPVLKDYLVSNSNKKDFEALREVFLGFYKKERSYKGKLKRVNRFFDSKLAKDIWEEQEAQFFKNHLKDIWQDLFRIMKAKSHSKTIVFAMKCLGVGLIVEGVSDFDFEGIPIPIDSRVRYFVRERLRLELKDQEILSFFEDILKSLKNINMIHLDSLIWQIGKLSDDEIISYFRDLSEESTGKKLLSCLST